MSKVDWSLAKSWADRVVVGPLSGKQYWANEDRRIQFGGEFERKDDNHIREGWTTTEFKPKPWSGPEDGLPPVGEQIDIYEEDNKEWVTCKVVYVGTHDGGPAVIGQGDDVIIYGYNNGDIRKPPTAADKRESAIREVMDIAQVDCRVTAARLVDAGFKRDHMKF